MAKESEGSNVQLNENHPFAFTGIFLVILRLIPWKKGVYEFKNKDLNLRKTFYRVMEND